jgi:hypothetical protein
VDVVESLAHTSALSHFNPQHWILCHVGLYLPEFYMGIISATAFLEPYGLCVDQL